MRKWNVLLILVFVLFFGSTLYGQRGVNNAKLNGNYAFTFNGGNGTVASAFCTTFVFVSTSATISASYNGTTRSATLVVLL